MLEHQNDLVGAIKQYKNAIKADPHMIQAINHLGSGYMKLGRLDEAQEVFKQGIEENPESAILRNNFGFCCLRRKNLAGAEQQFAAALALEPRCVRARMNLAITMAQDGRPGQSAAEFSRVLPPDVAYCNVAAVCMDNRDYANAAWALERALEQNPNCDVAKDNLAHVTQLAKLAEEKSSASSNAKVESVAIASSRVAEPKPEQPAALLPPKPRDRSAEHGRVVLPSKWEQEKAPIAKSTAGSTE